MYFPRSPLYHIAKLPIHAISRTMSNLTTAISTSASIYTQQTPKQLCFAYRYLVNSKVYMVLLLMVNLPIIKSYICVHYLI